MSATSLPRGLLHHLTVTLSVTQLSAVFKLVLNTLWCYISYDVFNLNQMG